MNSKFQILSIDYKMSFYKVLLNRKINWKKISQKWMILKINKYNKKNMNF